ncbi:MAG: hypothetical protein IPJ49_28500 [Candidatus Obscuribacter sp.]|nr:hypothetical protein [Candidatus Obscuribacter sp.]
MQLEKRILAFALLTFWLGSLFSPSRAVEKADNLSQLKNADPEQKVTVCIDLIDKKIIHPGMPISELDNTLNPGYSTTWRLAIWLVTRYFILEAPLRGIWDTLVIAAEK